MYVLVLPEGARKAAADTAALVLASGRLVPGTRGLLRGEFGEAGGDAVDVRVHAEALVDLESVA